MGTFSSLTNAFKEQNICDTFDLFYRLITHYTKQAYIIYTDSYPLQLQMVADGAGNILTTRLSHHPSTDTLQHIPITNTIRLTNSFLINTQVQSKKPRQNGLGFLCYKENLFQTGFT